MSSLEKHTDSINPNRRRSLNSPYTLAQHYSYCQAFVIVRGAMCVSECSIFHNKRCKGYYLFSGNGFSFYSRDKAKFGILFVSTRVVLEFSPEVLDVAFFASRGPYAGSVMGSLRHTHTHTHNHYNKNTQMTTNTRKGYITPAKKHNCLNVLWDLV